MADIERDQRIFHRDEFTCTYCGWKGDTFEKWRYLVVDHFKPKGCFQSARGFDFQSYYADDNLRTACVDCNLMKADREFATPEEAKAKIQEWIKGERRAYERFFAPCGSK
jgi:5-methylcytosine-specific restriction endonuclease McrA